ncbi:hypothetical protein BGX23_009566 [Mortierella sp. AD031]|nr:hypothetical protein BGX23_009566 [Mortierella sp. AD031]
MANLSRGTLSPKEALKLATTHARKAKKSSSSSRCLQHCDDVNAAFSCMDPTAKGLLLSSTSSSDQALRLEIASIYAKQGKMFSTQGEHAKAKVSTEHAKLWQGSRDGGPDREPTSSSNLGFFNRIYKSLSSKSKSKRVALEAKANQQDIVELQPSKEDDVTATTETGVFSAPIYNHDSESAVKQNDARHPIGRDDSQSSLPRASSEVRFKSSTPKRASRSGVKPYRTSSDVKFKITWPSHTVAPGNTKEAESRLNIFPSTSARLVTNSPLPELGARFESTAQLVMCSKLLQERPPSPSATIANSLVTPVHQEWIDAAKEDGYEVDRVRSLVSSLVTEFADQNIKWSAAITEVILLGPVLDREHYRRLLDCLITELRKSTLLDVDLLQSLVQLIQSASPDYLLADDLVRILAVLRTPLQDIHQQSSEHPYHLTLAVSRLLDVMVDGKVQDINRVLEHAPLSAILTTLMDSPDPCLRFQAAYASQALQYVPDDETRRQFVLRHAGGIAMGLLGVASVCKLDLDKFAEGVDHLSMALGDAHDVATKMVGGFQSLIESGQGILTSIRESFRSGTKRIWYTALREADEIIREGRLSDFNRLVFEAPCRRELEFQWGICQLLGGIGLDTQWDLTIRRLAIDFLGELYKDTSGRSQDKTVRKWILNILRVVASLPDTEIGNYSQDTIDSLKTSGDATMQELFRNWMTEDLVSYLLVPRQATPSSSTLLGRVQAVPDVEYALHRLKIRRLKERGDPLYIPPRGKPTLQSSDDTLFPLMEKTQEFLAGHRQVLLLLGDSGAGKSTFNLQLEYTLWKAYKNGDPIPLLINLPSIDNPQQDMSQLRKNLYTTNQLNQPGHWKAKVVISCRSQYLGPDYRARFQPVVSRYDPAGADLFQQAVIAPFSKTQIEQYVEEYVQREPPPLHHASLPIESELQRIKDYMEKLVKIPNLIELVSNPFLLTLGLKALPRLVSSERDLSEIRVTRVVLYDIFVEQWLESNKQRLEDIPLTQEAQSTFDNLLDADFIQQGINFQKGLAAAIYKYQDSNPVVQYKHLEESRSWKAPFFGPGTQITMLRESSPLARSGIRYRFLHRSLLEYLYSRVISDPVDPACLLDVESADAETGAASFNDHPLNQRNIVNEPSILQFLAERVELDPSFRELLLAMVMDSKTDACVSRAAANAITILVRARVRFIGSDLCGIRISGADLRGGEFDSANFEGADMSNVNLGKTWLRQANLRETRMTGVQFGELPYLNPDGRVLHVAYSPNGDLLAVTLSVYDTTATSIYDTTTWEELIRYGGYGYAISPDSLYISLVGLDSLAWLADVLTGEPMLCLRGHTGMTKCAAFSPDGTQIATGSTDQTVRLWSTETGSILQTLRGHTHAVVDVAFSPTNLQVASCSREDKTVRIWSVKSAQALTVCRMDFRDLNAIEYSPSGQQLASCHGDGSIHLWDTSAGTGTPDRDLSGHFGRIFGIAYSPDGHQLASCGYDGTVRLWDLYTEECSNLLYGHRVNVVSVKYSPSGNHLASCDSLNVRLWHLESVQADPYSAAQQERFISLAVSPNGDRIVTCGDDSKIQVWETLMDKSSFLLGYMERVNYMVFSPCGQQLATCCDAGGAVLLWEVDTGNLERVLDEHSGGVLCLAYSPSGHQLASASSDCTVIVWDPQSGAPEFILEGHSDQIWGVAYSPSGDRIASCGTDTTVRLWSSETGEAERVLHHTSALYWVTFTPDGAQMCAIDLRGPVCCWNTCSGESEPDPLGGWDSVATLAYSPDGKLIASSSGSKEDLEVWDSATGRCLGTILIGGGAVRVAWVQNRGFLCLATIGTNGSVRVWRLLEEGGRYTAQMVWGLGHDGLVLAGANIQDVIGLSATNRTLLEQRGALDE